jgi:enamine deaminase RidA (YjgF/YER057c/UK114 family)
MKKEVLDIPGVPTPTSFYNMVAKAGSFLFLAGIIAVDENKKIIRSLSDLSEGAAKQLSSGEMHVDALEGPIMAQTWYVYTKMRKILEGAGSSLENIMQATVYLTDIRKNFAPFNRVRKRFIKSAPPSTVLETPKLGISDDILLEVAVIALVPDEK